MSKFKIKLKITGFELEMEGDRKDVNQIPQQLSQQVAGFFQPAVEIAGEGNPGSGTGAIDAEVIHRNNGEKIVGSKKARRKTSSSGAGSSGKGGDTALNLTHDPNAWGTPKQTWNTATKSVWLLYVMDKQMGVKEMSSAQISKTFNLYFRQNGQIQTGKVTRDVGRKKAEVPPWVGTTVNSDGEKWFLTELGIKEAEKLVSEGRGLTTEDA